MNKILISIFVFIISLIVLISGIRVREGERGKFNFNLIKIEKYKKNWKKIEKKIIDVEEFQEERQQQDEKQQSQQRQQQQQKFYEVDAFGEDYVDFGAQTGNNGAYAWHANFPIQKSN